MPGTLVGGVDSGNRRPSLAAGAGGYALRVAAIVSVLAIIVLSLLITRFATLTLEVTGMSRDSARFQARSALTGTGFTTSEAEAVVRHPVRRRVIMRLMLIGNAGIVTVIASLILSFRGGSSDAQLVRAGSSSADWARCGGCRGWVGSTATSRL